VTQYQRPPGQTEDSASYQTNVLADLAESFVLEHRDDDAPIYLEVMPLAPHSETCDDAYEGPAPRQDSFDARIRPDPQDATTEVPEFAPGPAYDEDLADKPSWISATPALTADDLASVGEQYQQRLRAMLSVDRLLGRIVAALGPRLDDTVIVVTSDNGWFYGEHRASGKIYAYTESARVPLYIVAPGIQPGTRSRFVLNNDLAPTLLDLASPGYSDAAFDGRSVVPLLRGQQPPVWADRSQFLIEYSRSDSSTTHPPDLHRAAQQDPALHRELRRRVLSADAASADRPRAVRPRRGSEGDDEPAPLSRERTRSRARSRGWMLLSACAGASCRQYEEALREP
jgi:arylsulfatase A-like enzyme